MNFKIKKDNITNIIELLFLISISSFRLNVYIAFSSFMLILLYSILSDGKIVISKILKWGLLFWGYYILSSLWSENPYDTYDNIPAMVYSIGIFIFIPKLVNTEDKLNNFIKILFYSISFTAIYILILTPISELGMYRIGSSIGLNENSFGIRMAVGILISLYLLKNMNNQESNILKKFIIILFIIIFAFLVLFSGSKKALIFIVGSAFLFEFIDNNGIKRFMKTIILIFTIIFVGFLIFNSRKLYSVIGYRIERTILTITGKNSNNTTLTIRGITTVGTTDKSLLERQFYIKEGIKLFKLNPIFGYGGNGFVTYMKKIGYNHIAYSHNNFIELLSTLGIVGFSIYYSYWIHTFLKLIKLFKIEEKYQGRLTSLFLSCIVMLLILDYGCVSYILEFNLLILCLCDIYIRLKGSGKFDDEKFEK